MTQQSHAGTTAWQFMRRLTQLLYSILYSSLTGAERLAYPVNPTGLSLTRMHATLALTSHNMT